MQNETFNYQQNYNTQPSRRPLIITLIVVAVVAILGYTVVSALITRQNTGILQINLSGKATKITVQTATSKAQTIGTKSRLAPGSYQIVATDADARTTTTATVIKKQTTTVNITLQQPTKPSKVYADTAQNIFATSSQIYYLNTAGQYLSSYFLGAEASRPYLPQIAPIIDVYWLSPTRFFVLTTGNVWKYYNNGQLTTLGFGSEKPISTSVSFNKNGAIAFVTEKNHIIIMDSPEAQPHQIGTTTTTNVQTSIAPDKSVVISTPDSNFGGTIESSMLYSNDTSKKLPASLTGAANITWAPDGSKFSYTTQVGMFIYDLSGKTEQVVAIQPTNPLSATWLSSTVLLYAQNSNIMRRDTTKPDSVKLAEILGILNTNRPLTLTADGQHMYMGVARDSEGHPDTIYSFLPNYMSLSKSQIDELENNGTQNATLLKNLPHKTFDYVLEPGSSASDSLVINAQILLAPGVTGASATTKTAQTKQDIANYIRSLGLNPASFSIRYEIVYETLTGA